MMEEQKEEANRAKIKKILDEQIDINDKLESENVELRTQHIKLLDLLKKKDKMLQKLDAKIKSKSANEVFVSRKLLKDLANTAFIQTKSHLINDLLRFACITASKSKVHEDTNLAMKSALKSLSSIFRAKLSIGFRALLVGNSPNNDREIKLEKMIAILKALGSKMIGASFSALRMNIVNANSIDQIADNEIRNFFKRFVCITKERVVQTIIRAGLFRENSSVTFKLHSVKRTSKIFLSLSLLFNICRRLRGQNAHSAFGMLSRTGIHRKESEKMSALKTSQAMIRIMNNNEVNSLQNSMTYLCFSKLKSYSSAIDNCLGKSKTSFGLSKLRAVFNVFRDQVRDSLKKKLAAQKIKEILTKGMKNHMNPIFGKGVVPVLRLRAAKPSQLSLRMSSEKRPGRSIFRLPIKKKKKRTEKPKIRKLSLRKLQRRVCQKTTSYFNVLTKIQSQTVLFTKQCEALISKKHNELSTLANQIAEKDTEYRELSTQLELSERTSLQLREENTKLKEKLIEFMHKIEENESILTDLEKTLAEKEEETIKLKTVNSNLVAENQKVLDYLEKSNEALETLRKEYDMVTQQLEEKLEENADLLASRSALAHHSTSIEGEVSTAFRIE
eukprot:TRINITY_DN3104_c0_g1_i2.p1 TRINITY_DN3104_c0_g1~~TRINITY_DN3104_c0_g1_i2.p1  ORF type:complete len:615 (-),score=100.46 TRINITY_DN3104_c0_g1_i2:1054-2898(-)